MSGLPLNIDWQQILLHLFNFAILGTGLYILLFKPVRDFMEKRSEYYSEMDKNAQEVLDRARTAEKTYQERLKNAEAEIQTMKVQAAKEIEENRESRLNEVRDEAAKVMADAQAAAVREKEKIMDEAQKEIAEIAAQATEKLVTATTSEAYDKFLDAAERSSDNA